MSNHFTYEIDERNLRLQLKGMSSPVKEDAWTKMEAFLNAQPDRSEHTRMPKFQVALNRNLVLPAVFGLVIILFSFMLFNFISIHNPGKVDKKTENNAVIVTLPQIRETGIPVQSQPEIKPTDLNVVAVKVQDVKITPEKIQLQRKIKIENEKSEVVPAQIMAPAKTANPVKTTVVVAPASNPVAVSVKTTLVDKNDPEVRKKRKQRVAEIVETDHLPDIRPELITQERTEEVRPN